MVHGRIYYGEQVDNKKRRFGAAPKYFLAYIDMPGGKQYPAAFTWDELQVAMARAANNQEDLHPPATRWARLKRALCR